MTAAFICIIHLLGLAGGGDDSPGGRIMSYDQYTKTSHNVPYVIELACQKGRLIYFGSEHVSDPKHRQNADIIRRWDAFKPNLALNEGGDPPVARTSDEAVSRYSEAGLLRWLAKRDHVPIRSLDPTTQQEVRVLLKTYTPEQLKVFYVLRQVEQDQRKDPAFRAAASPELLVENILKYLATIDGLKTEPATLSEFESACRRLLPELKDWRKVPLAWFDPVTEPPPQFTNRISRDASIYRDRYMVDTLINELHKGKRVFAVVGASHVVMQEPELKNRAKK